MIRIQSDMNFTRRKFLQLSAFLCTAPAINKINGIASVNVDSYVPNPAFNILTEDSMQGWYNFLEENLSEHIQRIMLTEKEFNNIIKETI